uniref:Pyruvate decarboxylase n=1 Tax=Colletotrichum fructicola (strain Nara gc5) TaxID=1213859 RepID=L2GI88_COLFN
MADIRTQALKEPIDVAEYLFKRLHQVGVRSVHGLPGDYNLVALDYLPGSGLTWVGSVNELNAGYAADGYARVKGISAIITTFGVGELSAINALAGAYSEHVPVVHIVGCPSTISQRNGMLLHHTLGNGDFNVFANMSSQISCDVAKLNNPAEIANQIDHALKECWIRSRPVYVMLPTDMVQKKVEGERLRTPIDLSEIPNDPAKEDYVVEVVLKSLHAAKKPVMLIDACAIRHRVLPEVHDLLEKAKVPVFVTPMGKGAVNETHPNYGGVYAGDASQPDVKERVESSDLILSIGGLKLNTINFHSTHTTVRYSEYPGVTMRGVLRKVINNLDPEKLSIVPSPDVSNKLPIDDNDLSQTITQKYLWPRVGHYLRDNDIVVTETGTANFGIWDTKFPAGVTALSQVLWGSIGWSVGAAQGAALAVKDAGEDRRTILFVGDGSFQLTAQEITTMLRHGLNPTIFVICNDGFTIERFIHGMEAEYNDIVQWQYKELVTVFGGTEQTAKKFVVKTKDELEKLLTDENFNNPTTLQFVELYVPKEDAPRALIMTAEASAKNNAKGGRGTGAWQTPHQKAKVANLQDRDASLEVGDQGVWVTFARGMDSKAIREFNFICDEYGKAMYGLAPPGEYIESGDEDEDIESSIKKELVGMSSVNRKDSRRNFKAIRAGIECVFFMKTRDPVEPVELCRRICRDAGACPDLKERKTKYINRLTPVSALDKASENGVVRTARKALAPWFSLTASETAIENEVGVKNDVAGADGNETGPEIKSDAKHAYTYAIRPSIRSNSSIERDDLIKQIASTIDQRHKVNLSNPDRVILVDIFQSYCGMSVINGSDWDGLKKLNINEMYKASPGAKGAKPPKSSPVETEKKPEEDIMSEAA